MCRSSILSIFQSKSYLKKYLPISFEFPNQFFPHASERLPTAVCWNTGASGAVVLDAASRVVKEGDTEFSAVVLAGTKSAATDSASSVSPSSTATFSLNNHVGLLAEHDANTYALNTIQQLLIVAVANEDPESHRGALGFPGIKASIRIKKQLIKDCVYGNNFVLVSKLRCSSCSSITKGEKNQEWDEAILEPIQMMLQDVAEKEGGGGGGGEKLLDVLKDTTKMKHLIESLYVSCLFSDVVSKALRDYKLGCRKTESGSGFGTPATSDAEDASIYTMSCLENNVMAPVRCCTSSNVLVLLNYADQIKRVWKKTIAAAGGTRKNTFETNYVLDLVLMKSDEVMVANERLCTVSLNVKNRLNEMLRKAKDMQRNGRGLDCNINCLMDSNVLRTVRMKSIPPWKIIN